MGLSLSIPTVYIKASTAEKLSQLLMNGDQFSRSDNRAIVIQYDANTLDNLGIIPVDVWIDSASIQSYEFLFDLSKYYDVYKKHIDSFIRFNFYFYTLEEKDAALRTYSKDYPHCISGGRYCEFLSKILLLSPCRILRISLRNLTFVV